MTVSYEGAVSGLCSGGLVMPVERLWARPVGRPKKLLLLTSKGARTANYRGVNGT